MAEPGERTTGAAKAARQRKARAQARHVCWMIDNFKILGSHHTSKGTLMTERVTALEAQVSHLAAKLQASMEGKGTSGGGAEPHRTFAQGLDANCRGHEAIHSASPANKPNQQMATTAAGEYAGSGSRADHCEAEADEDEANGEPKHAEDEEELKGNNFEGEEEVEKDSGKNEQNDEQKGDESEDDDEEVDSEVDEEEDDEEKEGLPEDEMGVEAELRERADRAKSSQRRVSAGRVQPSAETRAFLASLRQAPAPSAATRWRRSDWAGTGWQSWQWQEGWRS